MNTNQFTEEICVGHRLHLYAREFGKDPYASLIPLEANCDGSGTQVRLQLKSQTGTRDQVVTLQEEFNLTLLREWGIVAKITVIEMRPSFKTGWRISIIVRGVDEYRIKGKPKEAD